MQQETDVHRARPLGDGGAPAGHLGESHVGHCAIQRYLHGRECSHTTAPRTPSRRRPPLLRTRSCPTTLTGIVRRSRTPASAITELVPSPGEASANWLTMAEPSVAPGARSEWGIAGRLPITSATAMLSPSARPTASVMAAAIPDLAPGRTVRRTTCQWVAPSAIAASLSAMGTPPSALRLRATTVGSVMMASTTEASNTLGP